MGRRSLVSLMILLAVIGIMTVGRPSSVVHGAATAKKLNCKYGTKTVTKKVHGKKKKVKVCKAKPATIKVTLPTNTPVPPTPTPTNTPVPPTPTKTPTATPTATSPGGSSGGSSGTPRFLAAQVNGEDRLLDTVTQVRVDTMGYEYGTTDRNGTTTPPNQLYFWVYARETNFGNTPYTSRLASFKLEDSEGDIYTPGPGAPADQSGEILTVLTLNPNEYTEGWMEFQVPTRHDFYTVLWTENGLFPQGVAVNQAPVELTPGSALKVVRSAAAASSRLMYAHARYVHISPAGAFASAVW